MRFLFTIGPVEGHTSPVLPLARALTQRGHEVCWYSSPRYKERIEATGASFEPYQAAPDHDLDRANELFPERAKLKGLAQLKWDLKHIVLDGAVKQFEDLTPVVRENPPDAVLGDLAVFAAALLTERFEIPFGFVNVVPLLVPSRDTGPPGLPIDITASVFGRLRNRFLNWLVLRVVFRDVNSYLNAARANVGLPPTDDGYFDVIARRCDLYLQGTIADFEYPISDLPEQVHFVGALIPEASREFEEPAWWSELDADRPVVLVTQGTVVKDPADLIVPALQGLADEDVTVVATADPALLDSNLPANACCEKFVPFSHLMPKVDVMVTNGGYGGTHYALTHGVPLVAGGQTEDKALVGALIAWTGVGINLKTKSPTAEQIRDGVRAILRDGRYKQRATALQAKFAETDAIATASDLLEKLATSRQRVVRSA